MAEALGDLSAAPGRGARHVLSLSDGPFTLIDESYNANPTSMQVALTLLRDTPVAEGGRRVAVLGDMLELGTQSQKLHAGLAELVVDSGADMVLLAGPEMQALADALPDGTNVTYQPTTEALKPLLLGACGRATW